VPPEIPLGASLADRAYLELRDRIVSLELPPGALVREGDVMDDLAIGRTPMREALLRLAQQGLVVVIARRGTFVSEVHLGEVGRAYELRRELEALSAGWAAMRATAAWAPALQVNIDTLKAVELDGRDLSARLEADQRAHFLIYSLAGNPFARDVLESSYWITARMWHLVAGRVAMDEPIALLASTLEAIARGDAHRATELARMHNHQAEQALRGAL
jgi:DNA-binding GntR family transcriptional regulator